MLRHFRRLRTGVSSKARARASQYIRFKSGKTKESLRHVTADRLRPITITGSSENTGRIYSLRAIPLANLLNQSESEQAC
jgi:hypothetical protein